MQETLLDEVATVRRVRLHGRIGEAVGPQNPVRIGRMEFCTPTAAGTIGWSAQNPRAAFFAFLAARFSFRLADAAFLLFSPPLSFDAIRGLLTDCGQPGRAALIVYRRRQHRQQRR